jgi:hypothetical protein
MIEPTEGRVVWYSPTKAERQVFGDPGTHPLAAHISYVHGPRMINIMAISPNGQSFGVTSVALLQDDDPEPEGRFCVWMPYQKGQAAKTEALEKEKAK